MTFVIGIDEAGYGPNLGPLTIGLSCWSVDEAIAVRRSEGEGSETEVDLYELLEHVFCAKPDNSRLAIADSKELYKPGGGLAALEKPLHTLMSHLEGTLPGSLPELMGQLGTQIQTELPWHAEPYLPSVPADVLPDEVSELADCNGAELLELKARVVAPQEFNACCEQYQSKGLALSHWTLGLLSEAIDSIPTFPDSARPTQVKITCDKHGGRNNYAGLLVQHFPEFTLQVIAESRPRSAYLLTSDSMQLTIQFIAKGEARLETALASMVAKYLRELSMMAFNQYWRHHLPDLKPTAGYPVDAKRFKADIQQKQLALGIDDDILWRNR